MSRYIRLLRNNPDFARLWLAQVISHIGDWFNTIVLFALVVRYNPENSGAAISGLLLARYVPPMIISPMAGVLVDRFDRKRLLIWSNLLRAGIVLMFLAVTNNPDLLWAIYVLTVCQFVLSAVFEPAQSAMIPNLISPDELVIANTLVNATWSAMLALGAVLGGVVANALGTAFVLLVDAITFLISALLIWRIHSYKFIVEETPTRKKDTSFAEGLRFIRHHPSIGSTLLVKFGVSIGNVDALMTIYATQLFVLGNDGQLSLGIMYSAFGIGAIAGPLLFNRFNDGSVRVMRRLILFGFVWTVFGWLVLGSAASLIMVCVALFVRAVGGSVNWTYSSIILQKTAPDAYRGRVFSLDMMGFNLATVTSTVVHGNLIDAVGSYNAPLIALSTMFFSLIPLAIWFMLMRRLERRELQPTFSS